MPKPRPLLLAIAPVLLAATCALGQATQPAQQPQAWTFENGRWIQSTTAPTTQPVSDPTLDWAEDLLSRGQGRPARGVVLRWLRLNKTSPLRDRALFLLADAYYQTGDRLRSFYHLDELMDRYPESPLFYKSLEKQYQIADQFLRGYKRKFLGMRILSADDEAIEMLFRVQQRAPGSPIAEQSLLRTADYYYSTSQFDLAGDAYSSYARSYPRSPVLPKVRLREAFCSLARFRGLRYDATPLVDARAQLLGMIDTYPDVAAEENLTNVIERIDTSFARKLLVTARYYERARDDRAAAYNYRFLIKSFPNSPEAQQAERALSRLPKSALEVPDPPLMNTITTQPAGGIQ